MLTLCVSVCVCLCVCNGAFPVVPELLTQNWKQKASGTPGIWRKTPNGQPSQRRGTCGPFMPGTVPCNCRAPGQGNTAGPGRWGEEQKAPGCFLLGPSWKGSGQKEGSTLGSPKSKSRRLREKSKRAAQGKEQVCRRGKWASSLWHSPVACPAAWGAVEEGILFFFFEEGILV